MRAIAPNATGSIDLQSGMRSLAQQPEVRASRRKAEAMKAISTKQLVVGAALVAVVSSGVALGASSSAGSSSRPTSPPTAVATRLPSTPDECIRLNGGDYTACNVSNGGRGDLPYGVVRHRTPNDCILLNRGDYSACNVGDSGRGDLPYQPVK